MATFPQTGTPGDIGGTMLDGPPPSPAMDQGMNPGMPLGAMVRPVSPEAIPPELLQGAMGVGEQLTTGIDSLAQLFPQFAPQFGLAKEALMAALAQVAQAGAPPTSPTAPGPNFPGGGFERGGMPLASGG